MEEKSEHAGYIEKRVQKRKERVRAANNRTPRKKKQKKIKRAAAKDSTK